MAASATVPDFGVEEITDDSEDDQRPAPTFSIRKRQQQIKAQDKKNEETQKVTNEQPIRHHHEDATTSFADKSSHYDEKTFASQRDWEFIQLDPGPLLRNLRNWKVKTVLVLIFKIYKIYYRHILIEPKRILLILMMSVTKRVLMT